jgi:hypothetical protein
MRLRDPSDGLDAWIRVHQRAAAAIDLHVDESRGDEPAAEIAFPVAAWTLRVGREAGDSRTIDDERVVVEETLAIKNPRADENLHQTVSVTLRRFRGFPARACVRAMSLAASIASMTSALPPP